MCTKFRLIVHNALRDRIFRLCWWFVCVGTLLALPLIIWDFERSATPLSHEVGWAYSGEMYGMCM